MEVGVQGHALAALLPGKARYPLHRSIGGPHGWSGRVRKISPLPPGFDPRTVQPVASRYTDWAIPAHSVFSTSVNLSCNICQGVITVSGKRCVHNKDDRALTQMTPITIPLIVFPRQTITWGRKHFCSNDSNLSHSKVSKWGRETKDHEDFWDKSMSRQSVCSLTLFLKEQNTKVDDINISSNKLFAESHYCIAVICLLTPGFLQRSSIIVIF